MSGSVVPGWEGSVGPFPGQYAEPHVYARDVHSGAGNCVCGGAPGDRLHPQIAPGVDVPEWMRVDRRHAGLWINCFLCGGPCLLDESIPGRGTR